LIQLDGDAADEFFLAQNFERGVKRTRCGRTRIGRVIEIERTDVFVPGGALGFAELRLKDDERGLALARKIAIS